MMVEPILLLTFLATVLILTAALALLILSYEQALKQLQKLGKEKEDLRERAQKRASLLLDEARERALAIIEQAAIVRDDAKEEVRRAMQATSQDLLAKYHGMLDDLKEENINLFKNVSKDIKEGAVHEVGDFQTGLHQETIAAQKLVEEKIRLAWEKAEKEIEAYKQEKLKAIDDSLDRVLQFVTKRLLGKTISLQDHEDLVLKALEEAKDKL